MMGGNEGEKLSARDLTLRLALIGGVVAGAAVLFAYDGGWLTPSALTPGRFADRFEEVNGLHAGLRRNHAKGVGVSGYFESNGKGAEICKASIFQPGRVAVIGRFSVAGGMPGAADSPQAVHGLGLLFKLVNGEEWRTAMIDLPVFPVKTPQAFDDQLLALAPTPGTGKPDPERVNAFLAKYPESAAARKLILSHPMPSGFEDSAFNGLNAFRFVNSAGATTCAGPDRQAFLTTVLIATSRHRGIS